MILRKTSNVLSGWIVIAALTAMPLTGACGAADEPVSIDGPPVVPTPTAPAVDSEEARRLEMVRRALESGIEVDAADDNGRTGLMMASFEGFAGVVRLMLEHGASPNLLDGAGRTALMYAASGPFPETVEVLLKAGARPDVADQEEHWTALMFAAGEGQKAVVEVLLRHGADPTLVDADGETAADHARQREHPEVALLLE